MEKQPAKIICQSRTAIGKAIWSLIGGCIIFPVVISLINLLIMLIPIIGLIIAIILWIISIVNFVLSIVEFIKQVNSHMCVTDQGVHGKIEFTSFNLTYDQIESIDCELKSVIIYTNLPVNEKKPEKGNKAYGYSFKNSKELQTALETALNNYRQTNANNID